MTKRIILAITGASGSLYALEFMKLMRETGVEVHGIISDAGRQVMQLELGLKPESLNEYVQKWYDVHDFTSPMASGSSPYDAMLVLPCSMGTLASIAGGVSNNLIHRAADVTLKERRPLLLAARETPFNRTHLTNMLKVHEAGAIVCPPMPAFYNLPKNIEEMARFFAIRLGDLLHLDMPDFGRWTGMP